MSWPVCIKCGKEATRQTPSGYYVGPGQWICWDCGIPIGRPVSASDDEVLKKVKTLSRKILPS